ncbi:MAG: glycosyltransferase family 4 protein [Patescibacteria group bacterium]|nr:glycosyltransferase family 4 protein [Patescibacteria group bacterium]
MVQNKNLVIAAEIFPPDIGGPATYSKKIAEELIRLNWQVKLICYSDKLEKDDYQYPVWRIIRTRFFLWHYFKYFWQLKKIAKDTLVIYAQGPVSSGWPAVLVGKLLKKKVVVKVVGDYAWEQARNSGRTNVGIDKFQAEKLSGKTKFLKNIESWVCRNADQIIVPSQYLKKIVSGWGVPEGKIKVIYNSFETEFRNLSDQKNENRIISVGRLVPWKGFDTLISLMPSLIEKNNNFQLFICGEGPEREKLVGLIKELNLESRVSLRAETHTNLISLLSTSGIFVLNTGYEGLSHVILETMAAGVPIITTSIGGNPELIEDGHNGLLVEYNNKEQLKEAILKIHQNKELGEKFVNNSKEVLKKFSLDNMVGKTNQLLVLLAEKG